MTLELNRRTFLAVIGASAASASIACPLRNPVPFQAIPTATPRCFMKNEPFYIPARPKTSAINYLPE